MKTNGSQCTTLITIFALTAAGFVAYRELAEVPAGCSTR
jgi:hypothetical protein